MNTQHKLVMALLRKVTGAPEPSGDDVDVITIPGDDEEKTTIDLVQENEYEVEELMADFDELADAARLADSSMLSVVDSFRDLQSIWLEVVEDGSPLAEAAQKLDEVMAQFQEMQTLTQTLSSLAPADNEEAFQPVEHELDEETPLVEEDEEEGEEDTGEEEEPVEDEELADEEDEDA